MQLVHACLILALGFCLNTQNITFSIKNDRSETAVLYVGKSDITLQPNASYKFTKPVGTLVHQLEPNGNKRFLFSISEELEGKKLNLSQF